MAKTTRILYVGPCHPAEQAYGTQIRTVQAAAALQTLGPVDFVVVKLAGDQYTLDAARAGDYQVRRVIELQPIGPRPLVERARCGLDSRFLGYFGHRASDEDRAFVEREAAHYDLVWFHNLRSVDPFGRWAWPRAVMDLDDVPSTYYRTVAATAPTAGARWRAQLRGRIALQRERRLRERFAAVCVCSAADKRHLALPEPVFVIPNGFAGPVGEPARQPASPPRLGFIGTFDYAENVAGVRWFLDACWPLVKQQVPDARLRVVGRGGAALAAGQPDVDALGFVPDAAAEVAGWAAMIVPVRTGAGTRVKIAEAFSRRCPVVATPLGAFGYEVQSGRELLLGETAPEFAAACVRLIRDPQLAAGLAARAAELFERELTWEAIQPRIVAAAQAVLGR
jgi:glycosyltransferase involved in cell wall biosynthesis